jgi:hypothetical protein
LFADIQLVLDHRQLCVIEVKRRGIKLFNDRADPAKDVLASLTKAGRDAFEQVVGYAVADGVPCAWLTNGVEHLVFRVQQSWVPVESRLMFVTTDGNLLGRFDDLRRLTPTAFEALQLVDRVPPFTIDRTDLYEMLVATCATASQQQLGWLVDDLSADRGNLPQLKYSKAFFVPRERYETVFDDFWSGESPMLVFAGEAGIGKTSLLCHFAMTLQNRVGMIACIFLDAFHLGRGLPHAIANSLGPFTNGAAGGLDTAIDTVEEHVLLQRPFDGVLAAAAPASDKRHAVGLRALLARLTAPQVRNGHTAFCSLLCWLRDQTTDGDLLDRYDYLMKAPKAVARRTDLLENLGEWRQIKEFDAYAKPLLPLASREALRLWEYSRDNSDATYMDMLDAIALLHASRTSPVTADAALSAIQKLATEAWLSPAASILVHASGPDFLAAPIAARRAFAHLLSLTNASKLLVIVDAINECPRPAELRGDLIELASSFHGRLAKILVSCRTPDLRYFDSEAFRSHQFRPGDPAITIDSFGTSEFARAWNVYSAIYDIEGMPGPNLTEICRQPLILRILCESYRGRSVPEDDIRLIEIFDSYWNRKIAAAVDGAVRANVLQRLAEIARRYAANHEEHDGTIPLLMTGSLLDGASESTFNALISEAVLIFLSPASHGHSGVRFMYETFHEYVLARSIRETTPLLSRPEQVISDVLHQARTERLLRGTLTYLLLWLDQNDVDVSTWLRRMFMLGLRSQAITTMAKLRGRHAAVAFARSLDLDELSREELTAVARGLAKHLESLHLGSHTSLIAGALRDPRRARITIPLSVAIIAGDPTSFDDDVATYILGFNRLWSAASGSEPPLTDAELALIRTSKRAEQIQHVAANFKGLDLFDRTLSIATYDALRAELAQTIRDLLNMSSSLPTIPTNSLSIREWMTEAIHREQRRTFIGRALQRLDRFITVNKYRPRVRTAFGLNILVPLDAGLADDIAKGHHAAVPFVAKLLRLNLKCRSLSRLCRLSDDAVARRLAGSVALGLWELGTLLADQEKSSVVTHWLADLSESSDEIVPVVAQDFLIACDRRRLARSIWRDLIRLASLLATDITETAVGRRRR